MSLAVRLAVGGVERDWRPLGAPLDLDRLLPGAGGWELEIGFGKGRYLRRRAEAAPGTRFLGIEQVQEYWTETTRRARRDRLSNLVTLRCEALYALDVLLPAGFADAVHVYFPDPWPKSRHERRRLFDELSVDLVLGALAPGATLFFASDALDYGDHVAALLAAEPGVRVERHGGDWHDGPRTNYESKYALEGRPIARLTARRGEEPMRRYERKRPRRVLAGLFALLLLGLVAATAACVTVAGNEVAVGGPPPLPESETAPQKTQAGAVWVPGFWDWDEKAGTWRWQVGEWRVPPRPNAVWVPPQHEKRGEEWVLIRGYWK
ncbi:MAG TPA: hypothetical protein VIG06_00950 [Kofleriaceae bacterium]|jgi:tRNA (guanine-N7-)-methyltransferase